MKFITLKNDELLTKKYNEKLDEMIKEYPSESESFNSMKVETIFDEFEPYSLWAKRLKEEFDKNVESEDEVFVTDTIIDLLGDTNIDNIYISSLNPSTTLEMLTDYKVTWESLYGVADNAEQVVEYLKTQKDFEIREDKDYVITMIPFFRKGEPSHGGWRSHKWGRYIGTQNITQEYIYDESDIDLLYVFNVNELVKK